MKTVFRTYEFDLSVPSERTAYEALCEKLNASGNKRFAAAYIHTKESAEYYSKLNKLDGQEIELQTNFITDDQWNTPPVQGITESGFRVFDWCDPLYPNRNTRNGYYLEQTEEMATIRREMLKCGYCGKMHHISEGKEFCTECLGSSYLTVSNLKLLRLCPAGEFSAERPELTKEESSILLPLYQHAQTHTASRYDAERIAKARDDLHKELVAATEKAQTKHDGIIWLIDHGINTDNVIYYDYKNTFGFGWRTPISDCIVDALRAELEGFPYQYQIVSETGTTHQK